MHRDLALKCIRLDPRMTMLRYEYGKLETDVQKEDDRGGTDVATKVAPVKLC